MMHDDDMVAYEASIAREPEKLHVSSRTILSFVTKEKRWLSRTIEMGMLTFELTLVQRV